MVKMGSFETKTGLIDDVLSIQKEFLVGAKTE
jgi:hypothetical protein